MRMLVSDMAGRASIELKGRELGFDLVATDEADAVTRRRPLARSRRRSCGATPSTRPTPPSSCCCVEEVEGARPAYFDVESWRVITDARGRATRRSPRRPSSCGPRGSGYVETGEGNGPVNALDHALREALGQRPTPRSRKFELIDYKVRILDAAHGTDAVTRVLIETSDGTTSWTTIGVAANILEASWDALVESVTYGLVRAGVAPR